MLKKLLAICCLSSFSFLANANIYQFTGVVDSINGPDVTFNVGDSFNFTIEVDFSSPGYVTSVYDGSESYFPAGYYAAQYLSGDAVANVNWDGWVEHYYWDNTAGNTGTVDVLNNLSIFAAAGSGGIQYWNSGTSINFIQEWGDLYHSITNNISGHVTNVSAVPLPAAVLLFGSGLLGLIGVARRKQS